MPSSLCDVLNSDPFTRLVAHFNHMKSVFGLFEFGNLVSVEGPALYRAMAMVQLCDVVKVLPHPHQVKHLHRYLQDARIAWESNEPKLLRSGLRRNNHRHEGGALIAISVDPTQQSSPFCTEGKETKSNLPTDRK